MAHTARKNDIVNAYRALRGFDAARFATEYLLISPSFFCNILARHCSVCEGIRGCRQSTKETQR